MSKRVSKILFPIAEDATLAPATMTPAQLAAAADGAYLLVDPSTGVKAIAGAKSCILYVKCGDTVVSSDLITKGNVKTGYSRSLYAASVARVRTLDVMPAPVVGTEYVMYFADKSAENYFLPRKRIAVTATAAISTAVLLRDAFVTAINAYTTELGITATNSAVSGITLTGTEITASASSSITSNTKYAYEVLFEVVMGANMEGTAVALTTEPDPGCGEGSEVRAMEETHKGYLGSLNNVMFASVAYGTGYAYKSVVASTYDLVVVEHTSNASSVINDASNKKVVVFSAPSGGVLANAAALTVDLETTLDMDASW